jgi:hypothetical protein
VWLNFDKNVRREFGNCGIAEPSLAGFDGEAIAREWEPDVKRASGMGAGEANLSALGFYQRLGDCQAHAAAGNTMAGTAKEFIEN